MKFFRDFDKKYEIYQRDKSESWYRLVNWYVILFVLTVVTVNSFVMFAFFGATPFAGLVNTLIIMPMSPLAALHIRKRNDSTQTMQKP